jgi:hypothetical protein
MFARQAAAGNYQPRPTPNSPQLNGQFDDLWALRVANWGSLVLGKWALGVYEPSRMTRQDSISKLVSPMVSRV